MWTRDDTAGLVIFVGTLAGLFLAAWLAHIEGMPRSEWWGFPLLTVTFAVSIIGGVAISIWIAKFFNKGE